MDFIHVFYQWIFIFTLTVGLRPPQNVSIIIKGKNVTFTWNSSTENITYTHVFVTNGTSNSKVFEEYVRARETSYTTTLLSRCRQYTVRLNSVKTVGRTNVRSEPVEITFWTTELMPPKNVNITMKDKDVHFSWNLHSESVTATYLEVYNGNGTGTQKEFSDVVPFDNFSYIRSGLLQCQQYTVKLRSGNHSIRSEAVTKTFWTTDKVFTADINTNMNLTWTTGLRDFYQVYAPSVTIYEVLGGGSITPNSLDNHYQFNNVSTAAADIHVTVRNVNQTDGGLYKSKGNDGKVDGCCLLIIKDKPTKPQLIYDKHPFIGFPTVFTCTSEVQRWPADPTAGLSYTFPAIGKQHKNILALNVTELDNRKIINCSATDDLGKTSESSDVITVNPYYGPKDISISPTDKVVKVTEGNNLSPITCSADCNPDCSYVWRYNDKKFTDGKILKIDKVGKMDNGTYRCRVRHPNDTIRGVYPDGNSRRARIDVNINVLYQPTIGHLQFSNVSNFQYYTTNYEFNEDNHVFIRIHVDSNPEPHLYFYSKSFSKKELKYSISSSYYTALLPSLKCEDSGQCTIEADNGIKNSTNTTVQLIIQCKPKYIAPERPKIGTQIGASENIVINVVAYPEPTVRWLNGTGTRSAWKVEQNGANYKYKLTSVVQITEEPQFGQYGVQIYNRFGSTSINIALAPRDRPQSPINVFVDVFSDNANITWIAGFDGGLEQSFSIKYKKKNENEQSYKTIPLNGTGIKKGTALSHMVTGLAPSTAYIISVIATNSEGSRDNSTEFTTFAAPVPVNKSGGSVIVIACASVGGVLSLIIIFLGLKYYRSRRNPNREVSKDSKVEYAAVNKTNANREVGATATADNTTGATNDVYAAVDKTNKKKTHNKGKSVEVDETEYANVGQSGRSIEINEQDIYENQGSSQMVDAEPPIGRVQNDDGLTYVEVTFSKNNSDQQPIIRGIEDRTEYMDIDFTRRAEPLQDDSD